MQKQTENRGGIPAGGCFRAAEWKKEKLLKSDIRTLSGGELCIQGCLPQWKLLASDGKESDAAIRTILNHTSGIVDGEESFYGLRRKQEFVLRRESAQEMIRPAENFSWVGLGLFLRGDDTLVSQGWGENGQSMMKMNFVTGEISVVMTNQDPGTDQTESGVEMLTNYASGFSR